MGLAASQARFLGLTARKSNTEYEGQQVNQQRTALANESASLYSQLTNLTVPTPPDITNFYTTEYSFKYGDTTYTMDSLPTRSEAGYIVNLSYISSQIGYTEVDMADAETENISESEFVPVAGDNNTLRNYEALRSFLGFGADATEHNGLNMDTPVYSLTKGNNTYYGVYQPDGNNGQQFVAAKMFTNDVLKTFSCQDAKIEYATTGDIARINVPGLTDGNEVSVTTTSIADDAAYDEAMNKYKKDYSDYEKTMAQINAKTEVIQQEDKTLELRLNQLDTEQNAISTEMDAVQKVIEKNVESTFKTFA